MYETIFDRLFYPRQNQITKNFMLSSSHHHLYTLNSIFQIILSLSVNKIFFIFLKLFLWLYRFYPVFLCRKETAAYLRDSYLFCLNNCNLSLVLYFDDKKGKQMSTRSICSVQWKQIQFLLFWFLCSFTIGSRKINSITLSSFHSNIGTKQNSKPCHVLTFLG